MNLKNKFKSVIIASSITIISIIINPQSINAAEMVNENNNLIYTQTRNTIAGTVKKCDLLNIRSGPSTKNSVVGKLYTNDTVTILEQNSNGWLKVQSNLGTQGWVSGQYINMQSNPSDNESQVTSERDKKINNIIAIANKQLGKPYVWGATGPRSFDCSGFTYYSYKNGANITLPRTSREQATAGVNVDRKDLQAGDLVFFNTSGKGISHVGMYIGNSQFIHASTNQKKVRTDSINSSYYSSKFVTARRIIK